MEVESVNKEKHCGLLDSNCRKIEVTAEFEVL